MAVWFGLTPWKLHTATNSRCIDAWTNSDFSFKVSAENECRRTTSKSPGLHLGHSQLVWIDVESESFFRSESSLCKDSSFTKFVRLIWIDAISCNSVRNLRWDLHEMMKWETTSLSSQKASVMFKNFRIQTHAVDPVALQPSKIDVLFHLPLIASGYNHFAKVARQEVYASKKGLFKKTKLAGSLTGNVHREHQQPIHFEIVLECWFHLQSVVEKFFFDSRFELRFPVTSSNCSIKMHLLFFIFESTRKKGKDENKEDDEKKLSSWFPAFFLAKNHSTWLRNSIKKLRQQSESNIQIC